MGASTPARWRWIETVLAIGLTSQYSVCVWVVWVVWVSSAWGLLGLGSPQPGVSSAWVSSAWVSSFIWVGVRGLLFIWSGSHASDTAAAGVQTSAGGP